jgi:hypothetical protein
LSEEIPTGFRRRLLSEDPREGWSGAELLLVTACDSGFVEHAESLARSLDRFSPGAHLLVHLVNPTQEANSRLEELASELRHTRIHCSREQVRLTDPTQKRAYYASARFFRLREIMRDDGPPFLVVDADALVVGPIDGDFTSKPEAEICLRRRDLAGTAGEIVEDHLRVAAGAVWVKSTKRSRQFFDAVVADLTTAFDDGSARWFVDQRVLGKHVAAATADAQVRNLKTKYADWSFRDDSKIWMGKGDRKQFDIRYVLLRESFQRDPLLRKQASDLFAAWCRRLPEEARGDLGRRLIELDRRESSSRTRAGIFLPRLDLPWKPYRGDAPPPLRSDTIELRLWWKRFSIELANSLSRQGADVEVLEVPAWEITAANVEARNLDLAFIPHRTRDDFGPCGTPHRFFMQEYLSSVFVLDPMGWSGASSIYPVEPTKLPPAVLGAWEHYREKFRERHLVSKFAQVASAPRAALVARQDLPERDYAFFPLQIPHDLSLRYFSDVSMADALDAVVSWARREGIALVLKEHPANRECMKPFRAAYHGPGITWSEANVHDILAYSAGVITLNSGIGFEALLAERPLVTLARTEYDAVGWKTTPDGIASAWHSAVAEPQATRATRYGRFVDWFLARQAIDVARPEVSRRVLDRHVRDSLAAARGEAPQ